MGGSDVQVPGPTPEQTQQIEAQNALLKQQTAMMQSQFQQQNMLMPVILQASGIQPTYDKNGNITGYQMAPPTALQTQQNQVEQTLLNNAQLAAEGKLPVNSQVTQNLNVAEQQLKDTLQRTLGPGWETSTPGIQAMQKFQQNKSGIINASATGNLSTYEGLALSQGQQLNQEMQQALRNYSMIPGYGTNQLRTIGDVIAGYNAPLSMMQNQQQMGLQAAEFNAQNDPMNMFTKSFMSSLGSSLSPSFAYSSPIKDAAGKTIVPGLWSLGV